MKHVKFCRITSMKQEFETNLSGSASLLGPQKAPADRHLTHQTQQFS